MGGDSYDIFKFYCSSIHFCLLSNVCFIYDKRESIWNKKNLTFIFSFLAWIFSIISFYQVGILAEQHGVVGQATFGDAFLSLTALVLLGKVLFYPAEDNTVTEEATLYFQESKQN